MQQAVQLFGVELFTQRRPTHQITEHYGEPTAFATRNRLFTDRFQSGRRRDELGDSIGGGCSFSSAIATKSSRQSPMTATPSPSRSFGGEMARILALTRW